MKPRLPSIARSSLPFAAALAAMMASPAALHADQIWDGGSTGPGDDNWNTADNWDSNTLPTFSNPITFTGDTRNSPFNDLAADTVVGGINFTNDGSAGTNAFTLSGARITLGGNITTTANTAGSTITDVTSLDMILNGNRIITTNQLSGTVQHNLTISGIISQSGTRALTKEGEGTLTLSGANTYTGTTTVNAGTLDITNRTANSGKISVVNNATLGLGSGNNFSLGTNNFSVGVTSGTATVNHTAGEFSFTSGDQLLLGAGVNGIYNLSGGKISIPTSVANRGVIVGVNTDGDGTFNLSGTGWLSMTSAATLQLCRSDTAGSVNDFNTTGIFNQTGGTANVGVLRMGGAKASQSGGVAELNLSAGVFTAVSFSHLSVGTNSTSTINISGTADVTLPNLPTARGTGATATMNFDGGTLKNSATGTFITGLTNAFIKAGGAKFDTSLNSTTVSQNLLTHGSSLGGGLTKEGINTLTLSGANTYTGATTVNGGTLLVNNTSGSGTGAGTVGVSAGTLGGTGSISGAVTIGDGSGSADAILAPGTSIESLATGNLTFGSDGSYAVEVDGTSVTSDQTIVTGTVTIDAATTLTPNVTGTLVAGQKYFIVVNDDVDAVTGIFSGLAQDAVVGTFGGIPLKISYTGDSGTSATSGGNDIVLYTEASGPGVDHFVISAISSPQTVGTPITGITITAEDASNATATGFTGTVTFSGTGGFSGTSGSFTAGVLTGVSVTPTVAGSNLTLVVTETGDTPTGSTTITKIRTLYENWSGELGFNVDTNGDGVSNGLAFLLGAANPNDIALNLLPTVTHSGGDLILNFSMLNEANRGDADVSVQHSSDLGILDAWLASDVVPDVAGISPTVNGVTFNVTLGSPKNTVIATVSSSQAAGGKLYGRLHATEN